MFSWFWRRPSHLPVSATAAQTPRAASGTEPVRSGRAQTWPQVVEQESATPRDVHRHVPKGQSHRAQQTDAFELATRQTVAARPDAQARHKSNKLALTAWQKTATQNEVPADESTRGTPTPTGSSRASSVSYKGLGPEVWGSTASVASAPGGLQHQRQTSSARSLTIDFYGLPATEPDDENLAMFRFVEGTEPGMIFPMDLQLPDSPVRGATRIASSAWKSVDGT